MPDQRGVSSYDLFLNTILIFGWILPSIFDNCFSQQIYSPNDNCFVTKFYLVRIIGIKWYFWLFAYLFSILHCIHFLPELIFIKLKILWVGRVPFPLVLALFFQKFTFLCPGLCLLWSFQVKKHPLLIPLIIGMPGGEHCITGILSSLLLNVFFCRLWIDFFLLFLTQLETFLLEH